MTAGFTESDAEEAALGWLETLGYTVRHGPEIAFGVDGGERTDPGYRDTILQNRPHRALTRLNPGLPTAAVFDAYRKLLRVEAPNLLARNRALHRMLVDGVNVEYTRSDGSIAGAQAQVIDFDRPEQNDWLAVNQFTVVEGQQSRRADIVIFVNGLPLGVIELKNPADEGATVWDAVQQLENYQSFIPALFTHNTALICLGRRADPHRRARRRQGVVQVVAHDQRARMRGRASLNCSSRSPASSSRVGFSISCAISSCSRIRAAAGSRRRSPDITSSTPSMSRSKRHCGPPISRRKRRRRPEPISPVTAPAASRETSGSVVWHTQGSGKSLTMAFYAGRLILHPAMENPTIVVITDRNDLDDQLFTTFARCRDLLRQEPVQAESRADLRAKLQVGSGGVVFTTIQKFMPEEKGDRHPVLSERRNIVVIADEAHRSQYDFIDGLARHLHDALPNASFIGFTGTPIEKTDANTRAVFGDYISIYDIQRAVTDGATVPIYYESRLAKLELKPSERPKIDPEFEELTEGEEVERKEKLKTKWAQLEAIVGSENRVKIIARDLVGHFEKRLAAMDGKAMIVCMSRRICVDLYNELIALRPEWHVPEDDQGTLKVVMTGSAADPANWQPHIRNKSRRDALANRFRDPRDPFRIVIVRDMWLTGFDAPSLHTMYVDKPMRGHGLMQAIARVNRVFKDKPGGRVVDYLGLADELKQALATYTESGGTGQTAIDQSEAVAVMLEKYEVCLGLFHGFDLSPLTQGTAQQRISMIPAGQEHILAQERGQERLLQAVKELSEAFALAVPHDETLRIRDAVGFFQAVRAALLKHIPDSRKPPELLDHAIRQIVSNALASDEIVDIFAAAGLKKPDISILSDEFLGEIRGMPQRNLAVELLRKLLVGEIKTRSQRNVVQARSFTELLERSIRRYQNRAIETAQVIEELIALAKDMRAANARGEQLGLSEDELAFYDALETNDSAVKVLGEPTLQTIARELVATVRKNVTIDWTLRENVRAQMRVLVRRILRKYGYPPDKQEKGDSDRIRAGGIALGSLGGRLTHLGPVPDQRL